MSRVCIFGDSITWGSWDPSGGGWVGRLREAGCNRADLSDPEYGEYTAVYNCGISGDKIADVLGRFDVEARFREPAAIVIAIGINDVPHNDYPGTAPADFRVSYGDLIAKAKQYATDMALVTPTNVDEARSEHEYKNADIAALVEVVEGCGNEHHLPVVNVFGHLTPEDLHPDGLHPGVDGHKKLYERIAPVVFGLPSLNS
jgi:lysophospholipase L1-like esterase